ncbi:Protein E04D5.4 a [Aphelenchoides avenae]|nr:Protein E04D5.4 a [Aphelenchus avenae]
MIRSARLSRTLVFLALLDLHLQRADAAGGVTGDEGAGEALIVCADGSYAIPEIDPVTNARVDSSQYGCEQQGGQSWCCKNVPNNQNQQLPQGGDQLGGQQDGGGSGQQGGGAQGGSGQQGGGSGQQGGGAQGGSGQQGGGAQSGSGQQGGGGQQTGGDNCQDQDPICARMPNACNNQLYKPLMDQHCKKTCNKCGSQQTGSGLNAGSASSQNGGNGAAGSAGGAQQNGGQQQQQCKDVQLDCAEWVKNGFCNSQYYTQAQKKENCPKSCSLC